MNDWVEEEFLEEGLGRPSKSQRKRESTALLDLGAELIALSNEQLAQLALPDSLLEAVTGAASIRQHGGRKRQMKFIGGLLRKMDAEPIREALARLKNQSVHAAREHRKVERWRDALLDQGDEALTALLSEYPEADRRRLRQLIRGAREERSADKAPKSARLLFRYLRELIGSSLSRS